MYTNRNKLKVIYIVQEYYLEKKKLGITAKRIWENVYQIYPMDKATFYNYLAVNARAKLKEFDTDFDELNKMKENVIKTISNIETKAY